MNQPFVPRSGALDKLIGSAANPARMLVAALTCIALAALARFALEQVFGGLVPYLFTFPAVIAGTLLGGARAGSIVLAGCQALTYAFVLPHWLRDHSYSQQLLTFVLSTLSAGAAIWATAAAKHASDLLQSQCEQQVTALSLLIREMDHRTKNNFQIAASLLSTQGLAATDTVVAQELDAAANRLVSIAGVYQSLSTASDQNDIISLAQHLERICAALRVSLLPANVTLSFHGDDVEVRSSAALSIGLVVNEWITNAIKYAFGNAPGTVSVELRCYVSTISIAVCDDGIGLPAEVVEGFGSKLVPTLVGAVGGWTDSFTNKGTVRRMSLPRPK